MSREIKIGILFIIVALAGLWGFNYLKGKNLLENRKTIYVVYDNVDQLTVASPVQVNGFQVGIVMDIELNTEDVKTIVVTLDVDGKIKFPKNTKAILKSSSIMGGKAIVLEFDSLCDSSDCLQSGDYVDGEVAGLVSTLLGDEDLSGYSAEIKNAVAGAIDTLNSKLSDADSEAPINQTFINLQKSMENMASATKSLERLMRNSQSEMTTTFSNLATLTNTLAASQSQITGMLANMETVTKQIKDADLGKTMNLANETISGANGIITDMQKTMTQANSAFTQLNEIMSKLDSGEGLLPQLLNDKELYTNLNEASKHVTLLLQDLRLNPKRYVRMSVFGRKGNAYTPAENDPAFENSDKN